MNRRIFGPGTRTKLVIFDMAGTIINEGGIIYDAIYNTLSNMGYNPNKADKKLWYGKDKKEVMRKYIKNNNKNKNNKDLDLLANTAELNLINELEKMYFTKNNISLMPNTMNILNELRFNNVKVALNTGYPKNIQEKIIDNFNLGDSIDAYISSDQVRIGRPFPYMIYNLMEQCNVYNPKQVVKVGDTKNDILEGVNANIGLTIGVLSGAGKVEDFSGHANFIVDDISHVTDLL
tara:strand:- start:886 stop:1587 length:702 start_codon:yes stop_codon:yes gene_type:complete